MQRPCDDRIGDVCRIRKNSKPTPKGIYHELPAGLLDGQFVRLLPGWKVMADRHTTVWSVQPIDGRGASQGPAIDDVWERHFRVVKRASHREPAREERQPSIATILSDIEAAESSLQLLSKTERDIVVQARVGQGRYREDLLRLWGGCAVTGCEIRTMLRASHLKPWRACDNSARLDKFNGLLLTPNLDLALDALLISFDDDGAIKISKALESCEAEQLGLVGALRLRFVRDAHKPYLAEHRARFESAERERRA